MCLNEEITRKLGLLTYLSSSNKKRPCEDPARQGLCASQEESLQQKLNCWAVPTIICCCCCYVVSVISNPVQPRRRQPTSLRRPWDSPGKNTGVGCYFLLQCMKVKSESEVSQSCPTLSCLMDCSLPGSSAHGISQARILVWVAFSYSRGSS